MKTKSGEYFGLVDPSGLTASNRDNMPSDRPVLVFKYAGMIGANGIQIVLAKTSFRREHLQLQKELELADKQLVEHLLTTNSEEIEMANSNAIIELAKTGDIKATEESLQSAIGQAVKRALWVAERNDEFLAIPVLQELNTKYNPSGKAPTPVAEIKDAKDCKLTKSASVDDRVWQAIIKKAGKVGAVLKATGSSAEIKLPKKEADAFIKAVQAVKGITVA